jgi:hypothetical protein
VNGRGAAAGNYALVRTRLRRMLYGSDKITGKAFAYPAFEEIRQQRHGEAHRLQGSTDR